MADKIFANGLMAKLPAETAPSFVKMRLSFKVAEFSAFLSQHENNAGWVNVDILQSKDGAKIYGTLNDYKAEKPNVVKEEAVIEYPEEEINPDVLLF